MAYVPVPKDLNKVKTKVMFNLTRRQLVCFTAGALVGLSLIHIYGHYNKVKSLQWLLTHSFYAKALAVKRVTSNKGKNTAEKIVDF